MTIRKNTDRASKVLDSARNIRCYSLSNGFAGHPLADRPTIRGSIRPGEDYAPIVEVSQIGFLRHELASKSTKLVDNGSGHYTIDVHSNLWFAFESRA